MAIYHLFFLCYRDGNVHRFVLKYIIFVLDLLPIDATFRGVERENHRFCCP